MTRQLALFKEKLEEFAMNHKQQINKNPVFRAQFQEMCAQVGVDPLASNKGFWAELLGMGDFYYELAVQIIDVCLSTRAQNGGLIAAEDLLERLKAKRGRNSQEISVDDIAQAIKKVSALGEGFQLLVVGAKKMVVSVPIELNTDHTVVLEHAQASAFVTRSSLTRDLRWTSDRIDAVLSLLLEEGMVWVDKQAEEPQYWFPSLFRPPT